MASSVLRAGVQILRVPAWCRPSLTARSFSSQTSPLSSSPSSPSPNLFDFKLPKPVLYVFVGLAIGEAGVMIYSFAGKRKEVPEEVQQLGKQDQ